MPITMADRDVSRAVSLELESDFAMTRGGAVSTGASNKMEFRVGVSGAWGEGSADMNGYESVGFRCR